MSLGGLEEDHDQPRDEDERPAGEGRRAGALLEEGPGEKNARDRFEERQDACRLGADPGTAWRARGSGAR
jgi:hypothetical protein